MSKDTGGSAFPVPEAKNRHDDIYQYAETGMTLRDYFAAKAMRGMLSDSSNNRHIPDLVESAYTIADAMLEARK